VSLPVPTTQHSRNRWLASSVEEPKAVPLSQSDLVLWHEREVLTGATNIRCLR
jgi:hypothetical protein